MVFLGDIAFYVATFVFAVGIYMIHHANHHDSGKPCKLLRTSGYIVTVISILGALCTGYYWMKYFSQGFFDKPHPAHHSMVMNKGSMMGHTMNKGSMQQCMGQMEGKTMNPVMMEKMKSCIAKQYSQNPGTD